MDPHAAMGFGAPDTGPKGLRCCKSVEALRSEGTAGRTFRATLEALHGRVLQRARNLWLQSHLAGQKGARPTHRSSLLTSVELHLSKVQTLRQVQTTGGRESERADPPPLIAATAAAAWASPDPDRACRHRKKFTTASGRRHCAAMPPTHPRAKLTHRVLTAAAKGQTIVVV